MKSTLIIVGGFLGAGKTSLLWESAKKLKKDGKSVGLITNDQASELVDTTFLESSSELVREVSGSCFCCNFNGFSEAIQYINNKNNGGVIIAEPVGSCTDLSATLMQPIKEKYADTIQLKPLTVLADPFRLEEILLEATSPASYIISKQFEEADIILINKSDLISAAKLAELKEKAEKKWHCKVLSISVKTGKGISEWLQTVLKSTKVGEKLAEVDYGIYADGEAAFGWLNASYSLDNSSNYKDVSKRFLSALCSRFESINANVGHVKFLLQAQNQQIIGNITGKKDTSSLRVQEVENDKVTLTVNARVETDHNTLQKIIEEEIDNCFSSFNCNKTALKCLIPGRPNPTYRYNKII